MGMEIVQALTDTVEANAQRTEWGVECWLARDLQLPVGICGWRNFELVGDQGQ